MPLKKTPLHALHIEHKGRMVDFAGYELPVQYVQGIKQEHLHCRSKAGLFDISHMGQLYLKGIGTAKALEHLIPSQIQDLAEFHQCYSVFTNEDGGIIDDLMVTNFVDGLFLVVNAACKETDIKHLRSNLPDDCELEELTDRALLSLQGPKASRVMQRFCTQATQLKFMQAGLFTINGVDCFINRCGYSGEDGFELSVLVDHVEDIARALLAEEDVELIGLGARDSLRLEAGYCLYGSDIDETTSPVAADLNWVISKSRLEDETDIYPGKKIIEQQIQTGTELVRVAILSEGKAPIRAGVEILNEQEVIIGKVSSGGFGPSIGKPIAMAYVKKDYAKLDASLIVKIRERVQTVNVVKLPFVKHRYYRGDEINE